MGTYEVWDRRGKLSRKLKVFKIQRLYYQIPISPKTRAIFHRDLHHSPSSPLRLPGFLIFETCDHKCITSVRLPSILFVPRAAQTFASASVSFLPSLFIFSFPLPIESSPNEGEYCGGGAHKTRNRTELMGHTQSEKQATGRVAHFYAALKPVVHHVRCVLSL